MREREREREKERVLLERVCVCVCMCIKTRVYGGIHQTDPAYPVCSPCNDLHPCYTFFSYSSRFLSARSLTDSKLCTLR